MLSLRAWAVFVSEPSTVTSCTSSESEGALSGNFCNVAAHEATKAAWHNPEAFGSPSPPFRTRSDACLLAKSGRWLYVCM